MTMAMVPGQYRIPAYRNVRHFRLTNKTPAAALKVRAQALDVAAPLLQATPDELDIVDGPPLP
jgi:hypothetical protein